MSDLRLQCTKFDFGWGCAPDHPRGAYSAPPESQTVFKGSTFKGRAERGRKLGGEGKKRDGTEGDTPDFWRIDHAFDCNRVC